MHIEKNVFDNIFNTVMDINGKTKDNLNARQDLKSICNRPELELDECRPNVMPKAAYTLSKEQKRKVHPIQNSTENELLKSLYWGPSTEVASVPCYFVNGYNFQTERHNTGKSTMNCVRGMKVHPRYHLVDVNFKKLYQKDEPFILAQQAVQVCFTQYSSLKRDKADCGLQVMIDNQDASTSQSQARQTDDDNKDDDEDSFEDDDTDDDEYELA
ncbi:UNVERIFIED_CONTAM: hypothetical protein Slati_2707900 [Sesamum latifolium]|uniref:DUF4216 domain-containing protein n=1 Tax=Sesamum latifolium TaxID=2727402 RepID=A0AAW2W0N2_9LAMI